MRQYDFVEFSNLVLIRPRHDSALFGLLIYSSKMMELIRTGQYDLAIFMEYRCYSVGECLFRIKLYIG